MSTPEEALKEGNIDLALAEDHQVSDNIYVVSDCIIQEVPSHTSHANDAANAEIVIANKADEASTRKINDKDVQAHWYGCSVSTDSYYNNSKSYFPYIPHESLSRV